MSELVRLHWSDTEGGEGVGHVVLPRYRAERLVDWILDTYDRRYSLAIEAFPQEERNVGILAFFSGLLASLKGLFGMVTMYLWLAGLAVLLGLMAAAVFLPQWQYRGGAVVAVVVASAILGAIVFENLEITEK